MDALVLRMNLCIDGVHFHNRAAWLEHKKLKRDVKTSSYLVRKGNPDYKKKKQEDRVTK